MLGPWLAAVSQPEAVWPVTVVGWVTFVGFLISGGYVAYDRLIAKGKREAEINGLGTRVNDLEKSHEGLDATVREQGLLIRDNAAAVTSMSKEFGETKQILREMRDALVASNDTTHKLIGGMAVEFGRLDERLKGMGDFRDGLRDIVRELTQRRDG